MTTTTKGRVSAGGSVDLRTLPLLARQTVTQAAIAAEAVQNNEDSLFT